MGSVFSRAAICPVQGASRRWTERPMALRSVWKWHEGASPRALGIRRESALTAGGMTPQASDEAGRIGGWKGYLTQRSPILARQLKPRRAWPMHICFRNRWRTGPGKLTLRHASPIVYNRPPPSLGEWSFGRGSGPFGPGARTWSTRAHRFGADYLDPCGCVTGQLPV